MATAPLGGYTVVLDPVATRALLRGADGPVYKNLVLRAQRVVNSAKQRCPVDTARLRSSIRSTMYEDTSGVYALVGSDVEYALYVHEGTRPHFPPPGALQPWAGRHGFPPGPQGAFMVALAIARHGTRAHPFLTEALVESGIMSD